MTARAAVGQCDMRHGSTWPNTMPWKRCSTWSGVRSAPRAIPRCNDGLIRWIAAKKSYRRSCSWATFTCGRDRRTLDVYRCGSALRNRLRLASVHSAFKSAPVQPYVCYTIYYKISCCCGWDGGNKVFWVNMRKICRRAAISGGLKTSYWSNRPGRRSAGSMVSGRLVAPITTTWPRSYSPSNNANKVATNAAWVCSVLVCRVGAKPSISSKKIILGCCRRAYSNNKLNCRSLSPTHLDKMSAPFRMKNVMGRCAQRAPSLANARASSVLPVPGGPTNNTPRGGLSCIWAIKSG